MRVAMTGATGFVGRSVAERLVESGVDVVALTRSASNLMSEDFSENLRIVEGDLLDPELDLDGLLDGCDAVINCAGVITVEDEMEDVHVRAVERLAEAAADRVPHFVQMSSVGVYGPVREGVVNENHVLQPVGVYETTKLRSESIVDSWVNRGAFTATTLRPSNIFGRTMPNQSLRALVTRIANRRFVYVGTSSATVDYVHVRDVADAAVDALTYRSGHSAFNISNPMSISKLVEVVEREAGLTDTRHLTIPSSVLLGLARLGAVVPGFPLTANRVQALSSKARYSFESANQAFGYSPDWSTDHGLSEYTQFVLSTGPAR